jgi:hypothetical protein
MGFCRYCKDNKCCNPTLKEYEYETHTPEMGTSEFNCRVKTPCIGVFFMSLENYQSVDVENGLA